MRYKMIDEPTCCAPRVDTFLAVTKVKPGEPERPQKTQIKKWEIERKLVSCLQRAEEIELEL